MGIFSDFLVARPAQTITDRRTRRELVDFANNNDADAPSGFSGRTGWAILKAIGATYLDNPPEFGIAPGYLPVTLDRATLPLSNEALAVIANQIAIDEDNPRIEDDLRIHLGLCITRPGQFCDVTPRVAVLPISGLVDDFDVAFFGGFSDDDEIITWESAIGSNILESSSTVNPIYKSAPFNGKGAVRFEQTGVGNSDQCRLDYQTDIIGFPNASGTLAIVWDIQSTHSDIPTSGVLWLNHRTLFVITDTDPKRPAATSWGSGSEGPIPLEDPPTDLPLDTTQIWIFQRNNNRSEFRRNGVQKTGATDDVTDIQTSPSFARFMSATSKLKAIDGQIARILRWERVLSEPELRDVDTFLSGLYL